MESSESPSASVVELRSAAFFRPDAWPPVFRALFFAAFFDAFFPVFRAAVLRPARFLEAALRLDEGLRAVVFRRDAPFFRALRAVFFFLAGMAASPPGFATPEALHKIGAWKCPSRADARRRRASGDPGLPRVPLGHPTLRPALRALHGAAGGDLRGA